jgi:inositol-phosphate phosphatase/L-galactose 1-phosphate phosphatase/histidinol-phosphatase
VTLVETRCPEEYLGLAHRLAEASGAIVRRYFRAGVDVMHKDDRSPVTVADREAESAIREILGKACPDHGVVGEEHADHRPKAEFVWVIDPIDGTKSFITGRPLFGTLIALAWRGVPVLGVIDHPALGERWIGARGWPTLMNGREARVRRCAKLSDAALFASSPHMFMRSTAPAFERVRKRARQTVYGSDCYAYALVASGFGDLVVEANMDIYDYLAAVPVIEGAGGIMTDWRGRPLTLASGDRVIAAGDGAVHAQALALLNGVGARGKPSARG